MIAWNISFGRPDIPEESRGFQVVGIYDTGAPKVHQGTWVFKSNYQPRPAYLMCDARPIYKLGSKLDNEYREEELDNVTCDWSFVKGPNWAGAIVLIVFLYSFFGGGKASAKVFIRSRNEREKEIKVLQRKIWELEEKLDVPLHRRHGY